MKIRKKNYYKPLIVLASCSLLFFASCAKKPSFIDVIHPIESLQGHGYLEVDDKRVPFSALIDKQYRIYFEARQMGVTGLVYGFSNDQSTVLLPKEKRAMILQSENPLSFWHPSNLQKEDLISFFFYDLSEQRKGAILLENRKKTAIYQTEDLRLLEVNTKTNQIMGVQIPQLGVKVTFDRIQSGLPMEITIREGASVLKWVWKKVQFNKPLQDDWFDVQIPPNYTIEQQ